MQLRSAHITVNGSTHALHPNQSNTFDAFFVDFQRTETDLDGRRFSLFLHPKENITVQALELQFNLKLPPEGTFFANGYQSWSESRAYRPNERIPRLNRFARPFMGQYGDEYIAGIPHKRGELHAWTYTVIHPEDNTSHIQFAGSLNERTGFTLLLYDHHSGTLSIRKDLEKLSLSHSFPILDVWTAAGPAREVFDQWMALSEVQAPQTPAAFGWTSWYNHFNNISAPLLLHNLGQFSSFVENHYPDRTQPVFFQIDDGWQAATGDWLKLKPGFPDGMASLATAIRQKGLLPGLWLAPFVCAANSETARRNPDWLLKDRSGKPLRAGWNPYWGGWFHALDFYNDKVREYLSGVFHMVLDKWGFALLKLDFLFAVALQPPPGKTRGGVMWEAMEFLREQMGHRQMLACGVPLGACMGITDYCRIGGDVHLSWKNPLMHRIHHRERVDTRSSLRNTLSRWPLNGRAFQNDPDVFMLRSDNQKLTPDQQYTLLTVNALLGSVLCCSDDFGAYTPEQQSELAEALALQNSLVHSVTEQQPDVWEIQFEQDGQHWTAGVNLHGKAVSFILPNAQPLELRPYETMILKR